MLHVCLTGQGYLDKHFSLLSQKGFQVTPISEPLSSEELLSLLPSVDAYVLGGDERFNEPELSVAKKLKVISFVGTGYTSFIDEASAAKHQIAIRSTPSVMAPAVAEHTIGLAIGLQRKLFIQNWQIKQSITAACKTEELSSLCVGIIGMGAIGSRVAKILRHSFGSQVIYVSRHPKKSLEDALQITEVSLDTLFSTADMIILALPTTPETENLIDDARLAQAKPGLIIINTAGARLINPKALKKYIENNTVASAAFDGYYIEPLPSVTDDPYALLSLPDDKFIVTPHTAAKTSQSWCRMVDMAIDNVVGFFSD